MNRMDLRCNCGLPSDATQNFGVSLNNSCEICSYQTNLPQSELTDFSRCSGSGLPSTRTFRMCKGLPSEHNLTTQVTQGSSSKSGLVKSQITQKLDLPQFKRVVKEVVFLPLRLRIKTSNLELKKGGLPTLSEAIFNF